MIVSTTSFTIMQFIDRYMVSRLGTSELAAVLPAGFVAFVPGAFAMGSMKSLNTFVSQSLGRGQKKQCASYYWQIIYAGIVYSAVVFAIMWPAAPWIFKISGQPAEVRPLEVIYLRILLFAYIIEIFNWAAGEFFMGIHRPVISMFAFLCGHVANIAANYVLIFGNMGFPKMGIAGAAWGTIIGMLVAAVINVAVLMTGKINRDFGLRSALKIDLKKMLNMLRIGMPAGVSVMINVSIWGVVLFTLVGKFGKEALAATTSVFSCAGLSIMPIIGLSMALTAAVGRAIGRQRLDIAVKQTSLCFKIAMVYMGTLGLLFFIFRTEIMRLWSNDPVVIEIGRNIFIFAAIYQIFHGARAVYGGALRGAGDTAWLAKNSALGAIVIMGVGGYLTVLLLPGLKYMGPWGIAALSIIIVGIAHYMRFRGGKWKKIDIFRKKAKQNINL